MKLLKLKFTVHREDNGKIVGILETGWEGGEEKLAENGIPVGAALRSIAPLNGLPDSMVEQFCWFLEIPGCFFSLPGFKEFRRF